jgi:hypothetical protein
MAESNGTAANGQTAPTPEQKALQEAKATQDAKNALLTSQKEGVKLEREMASAGVTAVAQTPLTGVTTLTDAGHLAKLVAYHSLRRAAAEAGKQINQALNDATEKPNILIVDSLNLIEQHALLQTVQAQVSSAAALVKAQAKVNKALTKEAIALKTPAAPPPVPPVEGEEEGEIDKTMAEMAQEEAARALPAAAGVGMMLGDATTAITALSGAVNAAAGVAALFRNEYTVTGQTVEIEQATARLLLAGALKGCRVFLAGFQPKVDSSLLKALKELGTEINALADCTAEMAGWANQLDAGEKKTEMSAMLTATKTLLETVNKLVDELLAAPAAGAPSKMMRALAAEQISRESDPHTHYLFVQVVASGGQTVTEKSLWHSGRITYAGGGALSYVLAGSDGCIVTADVLPMFSKMTMRNGTELTDVENVLLPEVKTGT